MTSVVPEPKQREALLTGLAILKINADELVGLFKRPNISEQGVRQLIQTGMPKRMPSFQYNFTPAEVDDLIAYLKIR